MESLKLYELNNAYAELMDFAICETEVDCEIIEALDAIKDEANKKIENIGYVIKMMEGEIDTIKNEIDRLKARKTAGENRIKNLKKYIENSMLVMDKRKIQTPLMTFSIQKNPPSVEVFNIEMLDEKYRRVKVEESADKKALLADLKEGKRIDGAILRQTEGLRIR